MKQQSLSAEETRLLEDREGKRPWKRWGPYISDRAWGTVREDCSADGSAWTYLTHDMARSKAYRWGEDAIAGLCDQDQILCFGIAFWNTRDPILKERFFGVSGVEGNHGEDIKELHYYLDSTPTHSYMSCLYKYPQAAFPYEQLVRESQQRTRQQGEYEILDTGVFDQSRYFDVLIEYAKASPEQIAIRITATNRGPAAAELHLIPQIWFRNTWSWNPNAPSPLVPPVIEQAGGSQTWVGLSCTSPSPAQSTLGTRYLYAAGQPGILFTENETNNCRLYGVPNRTSSVKDAFNDHIVQGLPNVLNPTPRGSKAGLHYQTTLKAGASLELHLLLNDAPLSEPFATFASTFDTRKVEADAFYATVQPASLTPDERMVQRQAFAGMLWSKQFYYYDVYTWLRGDNPAAPPPPQRLSGRNSSWAGLYAADIMSMPDKWEYPWFAAWDLSFHCIPLAMIDIDFAKSQLELLIGEKLMHPNGQVPAYEWQFSDVNPPVQAWAVWRIYNMDKHANHEKGDLQFLERCYHKLLMNFTWWVNRKDYEGRNVFEGGFLGLDNIGIFDRSKPLPDGRRIEQADGTGWMALFCLNLMAIGLELAQRDRVYEHLGAKFFEHFMYIASAINQDTSGGIGMWNNTDGWYYDILHEQRDGRDNSYPLAVRSLVGIVPLFAALVLEHRWFEKLPYFRERYEWLLMNRPEFSTGIACIWTPDGQKCLLSIANHDRLMRVIRRVLDESEFLSPYGIRSISKDHQQHPFVLVQGSQQWTVRYEPGESATGIFGGNSNWRGPVWFPMAFMLITALRVYDRFYGETFTIECPTGSGKQMTFNEVAIEIGRRLSSLFLPDAAGRRPMYTNPIMQSDPHFRDHLLFYEYFNGDTGEGLGASHQTGWTGLVAKLLEQEAVERTRSGRTTTP